jgi:predicted DNA-binding protein (MmcQ/YjbR family)
MIDVESISGLGPFNKTTEKLSEFDSRDLYKASENEKAFLIINKNTIELRTDDKLGKLLIEKYESVMKSRYFGRGGIEIVKTADQLKKDELADLIRLSYNLTVNS